MKVWMVSSHLSEVCLILSSRDMPDLMSASDLLIILSDIDGLFDKNPQVHKDAKLIEYVEKIDSKIESLAGDSISNVGTGGMRTKINAAKTQ